MSVEDRIIREVERKGGHTEAELAVLLFGHENGYQQRVNSTCRRLVAEGRLVRHGRGGALDPFTYHLPPMKRR